MVYGANERLFVGRVMGALKVNDGVCGGKFCGIFRVVMGESGVSDRSLWSNQGSVR